MTQPPEQIALNDLIRRIDWLIDYYNQLGDYDGYVRDLRSQLERAEERLAAASPTPRRLHSPPARLEQRS
jgi:hypothetical protein